MTDYDVLTDLAGWCLDVAVASLDHDPLLRAPNKRRTHFGRGDGGEIDMEHCCTPNNADVVGGQLVVAVGTIQPTQNFPAPDSGPIRHSKAWRVPVAVEVARCSPKPNQQGVRDWAKVEADTETRLREAWALLCGFQAALTPARGYQAAITGCFSAEADCKLVRLNLLFHLA